MKEKYKRRNCMPLPMKKIVITIALALFFLQFAAASDYYTGNVSLSKVNIIINASRNSAGINANYEFTNNGNTKEVIALSFPKLPSDAKLYSNGNLFNGNLELNAKEKKTINARYAIGFAEGKSYSIDYNLKVNFDGNPLAKPAGEIATHLYFSSKNAKITNSDLAFTKVNDLIEGQHYVSYKYNNYPVDTYIAWIDSTIKLNVTKEISSVSAVGDMFNVTVKVKNVGEEGVQNIQLRENILGRLFGSLSPESDFVDVSGESDKVYLWVKNIPSLGVGQEVTFQYSGKILSLSDAHFESMKVIADGLLVLLADEQMVPMKAFGEQPANVPSNVTKNATREVSSLAVSPPLLIGAKGNANAATPATKQEVKALENQINKENKGRSISKVVVYFIIIVLLAVIVIVAVYLIKALKKGGKNETSSI